MTEHRGSSFVNSCLKVPLDPYSRQPTPAYERPSEAASTAATTLALRGSPVCITSGRRYSRMDNKILHELMSAREEHELLEYMRDASSCYEEAQHLSDEQFKRKLDQLKRRQRMLLKNLRNCLERADVRDDEDNQDREHRCHSSKVLSPDRQKEQKPHQEQQLALTGKRCQLEHLSRPGSPPLWPPGSFSCLAEDQDLLACYRRNPELCRYKEREKDAKTLLNERILSNNHENHEEVDDDERKERTRVWSSSDSSGGSKSDETPGTNSKDQEVAKTTTTTTTPPAKSFDLGLEEVSEKYLSDTYCKGQPRSRSRMKNGNPAKKRRTRPVPLTSKIPLYDKLVAEKEERSRMVREESALSLLSQVRPFKLECERRALRNLSRSSPELGTLTLPDGCSGDSAASATVSPTCKRLLQRGSGRFKARPVPRNLFSTDVYDRMLEEEYFRNLQKRVRASELLKSASLPPSMARRERRRRSASCPRSGEHIATPATGLAPRSSSSDERSRGCASRGRDTPLASERCSRYSASLLMPPPPPPPTIHGNNLAAVLRAQASREKLEREIQERLEEKRREQMLRLRKSLIGRKPAWRALRFAARHDHERDLDFRASLRRDEAREQAERHRLQMELMLDRVTRIPTLFERYSQLEDEALLLQSFRNVMRLRPESTFAGRRRATASKSQNSSSAESYISLNSNNNSRPSSGSPLSTSSDSPACFCRRSCSASASGSTSRGKKTVSINEKAELIEEKEDDRLSVESATNETSSPIVDGK